MAGLEGIGNLEFANQRKTRVKSKAEKTVKRENRKGVNGFKGILGTRGKGVNKEGIKHVKGVKG